MKNINTKPRKHMVIPDCQVTPDTPTDHLRWIGEYMVEKKPDLVVCLGDFADMESLCSYDFGKKSYEGRRYKRDIEASKDAMSILMKPLTDYNSKRRRNKKSQYLPDLHLTLGNHECFCDQTKILTRNGWKLFSDLNVGEMVYTLNDDLSGEWQPVRHIVSNQAKELLIHDSRSISMAVTKKHNVIWGNNDTNKIHSGLACETPNNCDLFVSASLQNEEYEMTDAQIQYNAIAVTDSYHGKYNVLTFYQSGENANCVRRIIEKNNIKYKEKSRDRNITHICNKKLIKKPKTAHEFYMKRPDWCTSDNKKLPKWVYQLSDRQFKIFLDMLIFCDGTLPTGNVKSCVFYGKKEICEDVQVACIIHGNRASLTEYRHGHWRVNIVTDTNKVRVENFLNEKVEYNRLVWCASVDNGRIMVNRNEKPMFCGNCRITRAVESDPKLDGFMSIDNLCYESFGWEVHDFLKVFEADGVNYAHYFANPLSGRPFGGENIGIRLKNIGLSFVMGHQQIYMLGVKSLSNGKRIRGLVQGSCYIHDEDYRGPQSNNEWRGIFILHEVIDGDYSLMEVSLDFLCRKYEHMPVWEYMEIHDKKIFKESTWMQRQKKMNAI